MSAAGKEAAATRSGDALAAGATTAEAWRELLTRVRRRPGWVLAAVAALAASGLIAIAQAGLLARALAAGFTGAGTLATLRGLLAALLLVVVARAVAEGVAATAARRAASGVTGRLRAELTARLLASGPAYLERHRAGALSAEVIEGVDRVGPVVARVVPQAAASALIPVAIALYTVRIDLPSGLILLATGPLIPLFMWLLGSLAEQRAQRQWRALALLSALALDALQGLETLRLFGREEEHERALAGVGERYRRSTLDVLRVAFLSGFALELLAMLGTAMVAVSVGLRLATGGMELAVALNALLLAPEFYLPLRRLGAHHHAGMEGIAALRDLMAHLTPRPAAGRPAPARPARPSAVPCATSRSGVSMEDVWARYPGRERPVLRGVSIDLEPGGITALVGPSGSGKSSIARVLIGTLATERGRVVAGGDAVDPDRSEAWRARLAYVPQHPHLFAGSVLANLRLARPDATMAEVIAASRLAEADGFIRALPRGYATALAEDGASLSGGERQRLAIARAFLRRADVVVLDEISAYLDAATEAALTRALAPLAERAVLLVIAHRLETARRSRHVIVLENGRVVEQGGHAALLAAGGRYAELARHAREQLASVGAS